MNFQNSSPWNLNLSYFLKIKCFAQICEKLDDALSDFLFRYHSKPDLGNVIVKSLI